MKKTLKRRALCKKGERKTDGLDKSQGEKERETIKKKEKFDTSQSGPCMTNKQTRKTYPWPKPLIYIADMCHWRVSRFWKNYSTKKSDSV